MVCDTNVDKSILDKNRSANNYIHYQQQQQQYEDITVA